MMAKKFLSPNIGQRLYNRRTSVINEVKKYFSYRNTESEITSSSIWKIPCKSKSNDNGVKEKKE